MYSFLISIAVLIVGYFFYGKFIEKIFGADEGMATPSKRLEDGVDYVPLDWKNAFLIQFLNIAGLGPIFGAVAGALWGPAAFLWIVFGCIFAGAVHDYLSGMISLRHDGASIAEVVGIYLGKYPKNIMRVFSVVLLILVGVVFVNGPASILTDMTNINKLIWLGVIVAYYLIATVLPIDKLIAKIYPFFGASLLIMGFGIGAGLIIKGYQIPEISFSNFHPKGTPIFPFLFITIACGAISGFHATQSPMMARCLKNEKEGRRVFYGSMIAEGIIALIWAAAAMTFFGGTEGLLNAGSPGVVVNTISNSILGKVGGILALFGVVACPITSGDTAFRSARLSIADAANINQTKTLSRFLIAIPLFAVGVVLCFMDFTIIWRYFAWSNQTLATIALWTGAVYLSVNNKIHWIATIPATFMTCVIISYILMAPEGFRLSSGISYSVGILSAAVAFIVFMLSQRKKSPQLRTNQL